MNFLQRWLRRRRLDRNPATIELNESGFTLSVGAGVREPEEVVWHEVDRVTVFKKDCFGYDSIRSVLVCGDRACEVHEELRGWRALMRRLPDHLPGCTSMDEWFGRVVHPPFEPCTEVIFERRPA